MNAVKACLTMLPNHFFESLGPDSHMTGPFIWPLRLDASMR
jgi:hypothetical protein